MNTVAQQLRGVLAQHLQTGGWLLGDSVRSGGHGGSTAGLAADHGDRVLDLPIGERSALGLAVGLALAGSPVVVELPGTSALNAAVLADAVRAADFAPTLVVRVPAGGEAGVLDAPLALPGVTVWASSANTAAGVLKRCLRGGVHVILEARTAYGTRCEPSVVDASSIEHRSGAHVTIATWGRGVSSALEAAATLQGEGIDATVIELLQLAPVPAALTAAVVRTGRLVVAHPSSPSLAASVQQQVLHGAFLHLESPLTACPVRAEAVVTAARDSVHY